ncbi:MAG: DUF2269 family protein [Anaerolineae bacterium]
MNWYIVLKFFHIVAVIGCVGGLFARQLIRQRARKTNDVQLFATFSQAAGRIESVMVIPGMSAMMVFGVILGLMGHSPILGFLQGASQNWLLVSNILLIGILVIIPTVFVPRGKKFEPLLQDALAKGQITPELRAAMNDNIVELAHGYEGVALIIITALMVLKPF